MALPRVCKAGAYAGGAFFVDILGGEHVPSPVSAFAQQVHTRQVVVFHGAHTRTPSTFADSLL
jgi:hypothetical protein